MARATHTEVLNAAKRIIKEKQKYNPTSTFTDEYGRSVSGWFIPGTRKSLSPDTSNNWAETMLTVDGDFCEVTCQFQEQAGTRRFLEPSAKAKFSFKNFDAYSSDKTPDEMLSGLESLYWRLD